MFTLDQVVPWGRSFDEYRRMFALTDEALDRGIVGCGDGPASFNAEATRRGHHVVSCDPIYQFGRSQLQDRIAATYDQVLAQTRINAHEFVWGDGIRNVEALGRVRMAAMRAFLDDYELGKRARRYVNAELPTLPFENGAFDLALCSHLLFLYSTQLGEPFHRSALRELCRVAASRTRRRAITICESLRRRSHAIGLQRHDRKSPLCPGIRVLATRSPMANDAGPGRHDPVHGQAGTEGQQRLVA